MVYSGKHAVAHARTLAYEDANVSMRTTPHTHECVGKHNSHLCLTLHATLGTDMYKTIATNNTDPQKYHTCIRIHDKMHAQKQILQSYIHTCTQTSYSHTYLTYTRAAHTHDTDRDTSHIQARHKKAHMSYVHR